MSDKATRINQTLKDDHWRLPDRREVLLAVIIDASKPSDVGRYEATHAASGQSATGRTPRMAIEALQ